MHRILFWIKNILSLIVFGIIIFFSIKFNINFYVFGVLYIIYLIASFKDIIKKNNIISNNTYNIISILFLLIVSFIFIRSFIDDGFIYNSYKHMHVINNYDATAQMMIIDYVNQNMLLLVLSLLLILGYRYLNVNRGDKEYYSTSLILFVASIVSILLSIFVLININTIFVFTYLCINLILLGIVIFRFVQGKYKEKLWLFIVPILLHIFSLGMCAINLHYALK